MGNQQSILEYEAEYTRIEKEIEDMSIFISQENQKCLDDICYLSYDGKLVPEQNIVVLKQINKYFEDRVSLRSNFIQVVLRHTMSLSTSIFELQKIYDYNQPRLYGENVLKNPIELSIKLFKFEFLNN